MKLVTVATHSHAYFPYLQQSCEQFAVPCSVLGFGQKWTNNKGKIDILLNHINTLDDNEIILFTDAFDVIVTKHSSIILDRFVSFEKPIVLSINDTQNNFIIKMFLRLKYGSCNGYYINSGTYIGYVYAIKQMLNLAQGIYDNKIQSDQQLLSKLYVQCRYWWDCNVALDTEKTIFNVPHCKLLDVFKQVQMYCGYSPIVEYNDSSGCVLHGPGNFNLNPSIEKYLGVKVSTGTRVYSNSTPIFYTNDIRKFLYLFTIIIFINIYFILHSIYIPLYITCVCFSIFCIFIICVSQICVCQHSN